MVRNPVVSVQPQPQQDQQGSLSTNPQPAPLGVYLAPKITLSTNLSGLQHLVTLQPRAVGFLVLPHLVVLERPQPQARLANRNNKPQAPLARLNRLTLLLVCLVNKTNNSNKNRSVLLVQPQVVLVQPHRLQPHLVLVLVVQPPTPLELQALNKNQVIFLHIGSML